MSTAEDDAEQERAWEVLYDQVREILGQYGSENYLGDADYLVVDDNYGWLRQKIEVHKLHMLQPPIVKRLQQLLNEYPEWEIVLAVSVPGTEGKWPLMGVTIRKHEVIDGLQRQYLPGEFRGIEYAGSRPGTGFD
jgi:hypothetical protein